MPAPTEGGEAGTFHHYFVGNLLLPPYFEDTTVTSEMLILMFFLQGPRFAAVQQGTANRCTMDSGLCADGYFEIIPNSYIYSTESA